jgi:prepilin peptidase CpaA
MITTMDWVLIAVVTFCGITDVFWNKIYNPVTFSAIISGFLVAWLGHGPNTLSGQPVEVADALLGFVAGFVPFFILYVIGGMAGGDVKLMGAIGAIKGPLFIAYTMMYSVFLGAVFGVIAAGFRGQLMPIIKRVGYTILHTLTPTVGPTSYLDTKGPKVNFGFAICLGTLLCLLGQIVGRQLIDL